MRSAVRYPAAAFPKILIVLFAAFVAASLSVSYLVSGFIVFDKPRWIFICLIPLFQSVIVFFIVQLRGSFSGLLNNLARSSWFWLLGTTDAAFLILVWQLRASQASQAWPTHYYTAAKGIFLGVAALVLLWKRTPQPPSRWAYSAAALCLIVAGLETVLPTGVPGAVGIVLTMLPVLAGAGLYQAFRRDSPGAAAFVAAAVLFLAPAALIASCAYANAPELNPVSRWLASSFIVPGLTLIWLGLLMRSRNPDSAA